MGEFGPENAKTASHSLIPKASLKVWHQNKPFQACYSVFMRHWLTNLLRQRDELDAKNMNFTEIYNFLLIFSYFHYAFCE